VGPEYENPAWGAIMAFVFEVVVAVDDEVAEVMYDCSSERRELELSVYHEPEWEAEREYIGCFFIPVVLLLPIETS